MLSGANASHAASPCQPGFRGSIDFIVAEPQGCEVAEWAIIVLWSLVVIAALIVNLLTLRKASFLLFVLTARSGSGVGLSVGRKRCVAHLCRQRPGERCPFCGVLALRCAEDKLGQVFIFEVMAATWFVIVGFHKAVNPGVGIATPSAPFLAVAFAMACASFWSLALLFLFRWVVVAVAMPLMRSSRSEVMPVFQSMLSAFRVTAAIAIVSLAGSSLGGIAVGAGDRDARYWLLFVHLQGTAVAMVLFAILPMACLGRRLATVMRDALSLGRVPKELGCCASCLQECGVLVCAWGVEESMVPSQRRLGFRLNRKDRGAIVVPISGFTDLPAYEGSVRGGSGSNRSDAASTGRERDGQQHGPRAGGFPVWTTYAVRSKGGGHRPEAHGGGSSSAGGGSSSGGGGSSSGGGLELTSLSRPSEREEEDEEEEDDDPDGQTDVAVPQGQDGREGDVEALGADKAPRVPGIDTPVLQAASNGSAGVGTSPALTPISAPPSTSFPKRAGTATSGQRTPRSGAIIHTGVLRSFKLQYKLENSLVRFQRMRQSLFVNFIGQALSMSLVLHVPLFRGLTDYWLPVSWLMGHILAIYLIETITIPVPRSVQSNARRVSSLTVAAEPRERGPEEPRRGCRVGLFLYWCCIIDPHLGDAMRELQS